MEVKGTGNVDRTIMRKVTKGTSATSDSFSVVGAE